MSARAERRLSWLLALLAWLAGASLAPSTLSSSAQEFGSANQQVSQGQAVNPKLPKINIFISGSEIKKLLGIDKPINYVTNGNINTYPFRFSIPLGYNQSDMIFTWQNLGQTNVNYSISLTIGNVLAVEAPLINITRSGLIPRHEQVFKITLPCSGKVTDEVDVQVLINIFGFLETGEQPDAAEQPSSDAQEPANATETEAGQAEPKQAIQASRLRPVAHKLAIKRKKICTQQPVQVAVQPRLPLIQPANQRPAPAATAPTGPPVPSAGAPAVQSSAEPALSAPESAPTSERPTSRNQRPPNEPAPETEPTHSDAHLLPPAPANTPLFGAQPAVRPPLGFYPSWPHSLQLHHMAGPPLDILRPQAPHPHQQQVSGVPGGQHPAPAAPSNSPLVVSLVVLSLLVSLALVVVAILGSSGSAGRHKSPLDKLASITGCLLKRAPGARKAKCISSNVVSGTVIGSLRAGPKSSASSVSGISSVSSKSQANAKQQAFSYCVNYKPANWNSSQYYTNQFNSQPQQHQYQQHLPTADLLGTGYQCLQQQQQQQQQQQSPPQYPIYHIATGNNPSQTTRLIWSPGNGTSPDAFTVDNTYTPLSNAPRSETGSVYQTIY